MNHNLSIQYDDIVLKPMTIGESIEYIRLRNDLSIRKCFFDDSIIAPEQQKKWFSTYLNSKNDYMFSILDIDGFFVGGCGVYNIDDENKSAEFGRIIIDPKYKHRGYATRAILGVMEIVNKEIGIQYIKLFVKKDNIEAIQLYKKVGFHILYDDNAVLCMARMNS